MRLSPLAPRDMLLALERFAPQARPYNFDDMFDCWGFQRRLFDWLDDGYELNLELSEGAALRADWRLFGARDDALPGDVLVSHPHPDAGFHTVIYAGRVGGHHLVFDTSPRPRVPLFEDGRLTGERQVYTRFMRATETTDRLRHDGGAYLRLWDDRVRYLHEGLHARLAARNVEGERDLPKLRRAAGLSELPFYCRRRLVTDARGRELYDNRKTRSLDYYTPDGASLPDDAYEATGWAGERGAPDEAGPLRPAPPKLAGLPHRIIHEGEWTVSWEPGNEPDPATCAGRAEARGGRSEDRTGDSSGVRLDAWRVEVWEETHDLWKHRLLRRDLPPEERSFSPPVELLPDESRFALVVFAHDERGWSAPALATALWRPGPGHPLLGYNATRPIGLEPDLLRAVRPVGESFEFRWSIPEAAVTQSAVRIRLLEDACLADDAQALLDLDLAGPEATACRCRIPAALLRSGHTYTWYVDARDAAGRWTFAPAEAVFIVE